jgi:hypothetical protein
MKKICSKCKIEKEWSEFSLKKTRKNEFVPRSRCKQCRSPNRKLKLIPRDGFKFCGKCKVEKEVDQFHKNKIRTDGLSFWCKQCRLDYNDTPKRKEYGRKYRARPDIKNRTKIYYEVYFSNPEKVAIRKEYCKAYNSRPEMKIKERYRYLLTSYNLTPEMYNNMLESQGFKCKICKEDDKGTFNVDHDHSCCPGKKSCGKCVRGLLCLDCNAGLGMFGESYINLKSAVEYLESSAKKSLIDTQSK